MTAVKDTDIDTNINSVTETTKDVEEYSKYSNESRPPTSDPQEDDIGPKEERAFVWDIILS